MGMMKYSELQQYFERWHYTEHKYIEMLETRDETGNIAIIWQDDIIAMIETMMELLNIINENMDTEQIKNCIQAADYQKAKLWWTCDENYNYYCQGV